MIKGNQVEKTVTHLADVYREAGYSVSVDCIADGKCEARRSVRVSKGDVSVVAHLFGTDSVARAEVKPTAECLAKVARQSLIGHIGYGDLIAPGAFSLVGLIRSCLAKGLVDKVRNLAMSLQQTIEDSCPAGWRTKVLVDCCF